MILKKTHFGEHYLVDFHACEPNLLKFVDPIRKIVLRAAKECGATILQNFFHQFEPEGVSGVLTIAESHISIHTWPENGFVAADIFTCGKMQPQIAVDIMSESFRARKVILKRVVRGELEHD
jgi:S-adenosylmethionine decarboxylase proenzyme